MNFKAKGREGEPPTRPWICFGCNQNFLWRSITGQFSFKLHLAAAFLTLRCLELATALDAWFLIVFALAVFRQHPCLLAFLLEPTQRLFDWLIGIYFDNRQSAHLPFHLEMTGGNVSCLNPPRHRVL